MSGLSTILGLVLARPARFDDHRVFFRAIISKAL